ncbi:hypothetical protein FQN51_005327 [Onygenales sp. PD_10]|nr:hypothetical protein FQN51_005327 [Onygenales sp. PD_10]
MLEKYSNLQEYLANCGAKNTAERIRAFLDFHLIDAGDGAHWESPLIKALQVTRTDDNVCEFEFTVKPEMCNPFGTLHGGCATTILDLLSSAVVLTVPGPEGDMTTAAVSKNIMISFLRPVMVGQTVKVVIKIVMELGAHSSYTGCISTMDGKVCVSFAHDKHSMLKGKM